MAEERKYSLKELKGVVEALGLGQKHDASSATPSNVPTHGPLPGNNAQFGVFTTPGVRPGMWNATPRGRSIGQFIPMYPSLIMNELIEVATGVTAGTGNNVTSACAVGPKPGALKAMSIAAKFGIVHMSTKIFDLTQAGMRRNRADVDRQFFNAAQVNNPWLPMVPGINGDGDINKALTAEMLALGIDMERNIGQVHHVGVADTENNDYRGIARQWNGLDRLIRTGWTDASSGQSVPMADAQVISFNQDLDSVLPDGRTFIATLIDAYFSQVDFLTGIGVNPVFALAMRPELFRAIAAIWSCSYATTRCISSDAGAPVVRSADAQLALYNDILRNQYLPMEGVDVPVVFDDFMPRETLGNNYYKADILGVALSGNGRPTVYGEYFDMNNADAQAIANAFGITDATTSTVNNGLYRVFKRVTGGCIEYDFFARPRLITDAPFMHFRIDDVWYKSFVDRHTPIPGLSGYVNGGYTYTS